MDIVINRIEIANEEDIAYARQRSRLIAELLGFARNDQVRISTAVSEIARNAFQHARDGEAIFSVKNKPPAQLFAITVRDQGPGIKNAEAILEGGYKSTTGMGQGIMGTRRLMDHFHLETQIGVGTTVYFAKNLPPSTPEITPRTISEITKELAKARSNSPLEEIRLQNKELLKTMNELKESEEKYRQIVDNISDVVWTTDLNFNLTYVSPSVEKLVGEPVEIHLKKSVEERFPPESLNTISTMIKEELEKDPASNTNKSSMIEVKHFRVDGSVIWVSMHVSTVRDQNGNVIGFQGSTRDVAERKDAEEKIQYLSFHDNLTGLYNRVYLENEMKRLDTERQLPIILVMADLNNLKLVNDTFGHELGDKMLKHTAEILRSSCRSEDIIARWGGDEFVIFLPQTKEEDANNICKRINKKCKETYVKDIPLSLALGTAVKNKANMDLAEILKDAEENMYKQKLTEIKQIRSTVLNTMLKNLEAKSFETEAHYSGMQDVAQKISKKVRISESELNRLKELILLHDIGKINISEEILTKPGPLSDKEWELIKKHPEMGWRIARATEDFAHVAEDILRHHERWDGKGYPYGRKGKEIPLLARITAIADSYDVMSHGRPYKRPMDREEIVAEFKRCAGTQFDPELVEIFLSILEEKYDHSPSKR